MIVQNNHTAVRSLSPIMMDLSKKERVEDANKTQEILIKLSLLRQRFVIGRNNHSLTVVIKEYNIL
ncbi:hypothetical protein DR190_15850 [Klebsiella pneumoniae]|nr:hypothetical protein DR191_16250 [Klebsiella pneumoniae]UUO78540.1 hypothetical protein DR190_15850 [Klebsiella pneumoniae]UUO84273.1 hypothetical protein DR189_16250 [Klebsiella pneumoniae]UUO89934.1 hypothetical protein DR188_16240 [Klebsiella pneumoniae]